jgi:hypothetical protein
MATVQRWSGRHARALREALRLSVRDFAGYLGVAVRTVASWEARGPGIVPRPDLQAVLDTALQRAGPEAQQRFRLSLAGHSSDRPAAPGYTGPHLAAVPDPPEEPPPGSQGYAAALRSLRAADRQVGGGYLYATVVGYLHRDVAPGLFGADDPEVFTAAAALTEMAGWMAHEAGHDQTAWAHLARSLDLAQVGGDRQLAAHVLASMSHLAHHLTRPAEATELARRGQHMLTGGLPHQPQLQALLLAMQARGLAGQDPRGCTRLLHQAGQVLETTPDEPPSPWVSGFDEAALATETARCLRQIGEHAAAGRQAERLLTLRTADRPRSRAFGQLLLACVLVYQDRLEEACQLAHQVLEATRHLGSYPIVQQLRGLGHQLAPQRAHRPVAELLDTLHEQLRQRSWLAPPPHRPAHQHPERTAEST